MSHIFFEKNSNYIVAENFDKDQFVVEVSYAPESTQLELVFDPSEEYFEELQEKLTTGEWEHFVLKVAAYYDGQEMASDYLGSNISADPAKYIEADKVMEYLTILGVAIIIDFAFVIITGQPLTIHLT